MYGFTLIFSNEFLQYLDPFIDEKRVKYVTNNNIFTRCERALSLICKHKKSSLHHMILKNNQN